MGEAALRRITVDEFLAWDSGDDLRYELVGGEIVAMTPPANAHVIIVNNTKDAIKEKLKPPCRVYSEIGIILSDRNDTYYQADVAVICSPIPPRDHGVTKPVIIIEVFSPSTMAHDKAVKLADYRHIPSVQAIVFIASEEKRVELWRRGTDLWTVIELEASGILQLDAIGFDIPVEALYEGLDLSQAAGARA
jgi:Uma2 family endonuclease